MRIGHEMDSGSAVNSGSVRAQCPQTLTGHASVGMAGPDLSRPLHSPVPPCQLLVWKGAAGSPAWLMRLGLAALCQPKRTCVGADTPAADTTTVTPSRAAVARTNL